LTTEGFWQIVYDAPKGPPVLGVLVFQAGIVVGADAFGGIYDGSYIDDGELNGIVIKVMARTSVTGPYVVIGGPSLKAGRSFSVRGVLQHGRDTAILHTDGGPITVAVRKLRDLPLPVPAPVGDASVLG
jgi:hypothetical protein